MTYDVIVIGAGIGGLGCAAKLAKHGKKVLVLEKDRHIGGTSYIFKRKGYSFPMGPLSFSFPGLVRSVLLETGVGTPLEFKRNHFQLITPSLNIIFSRPLKDIKEELKKIFAREQRGLDAFFPELEDFGNREFEVCLWSANAPGLVPQGKESLVLRVGFPYDHFSRFRTGEKRRREDYQGYKIQLVQNLIRAAEHILPGLSSSIEVMETATPLTYQDWGHRYRGSIAGWTWSADYERAFGRKLLIETPIQHLLMAGIYAASELFLGGVPTALQTANLTADLVLS